jgi:hypothetical protein
MKITKAGLKHMVKEAFDNVSKANSDGETMTTTKSTLRRMIMEELTEAGVLDEYGIGLNPGDEELHGEDPPKTSFLNKAGVLNPDDYEAWFASLGEDVQKKIKADTEARNAAAAASDSWMTSGEKDWRSTAKEPKI